MVPEIREQSGETGLMAIKLKQDATRGERIAICPGERRVEHRCSNRDVQFPSIKAIVPAEFTCSCVCRAASSNKPPQGAVVAF